MLQTGEVLALNNQALGSENNILQVGGAGWVGWGGWGGGVRGV